MNELAGIFRMLAMREAIASVSLSHPDSCTCDICKAATGDDDAMVRLLMEQADLDDKRR